MTSTNELSYIPFAETERLYVRAFRMSDVDPLIAMFNDPRVLRTNPSFFVPGSEGGGAGTLRDKLPVRAAGALLWAMLESKESLEDGSTWVGMVGLAVDGTPKNREVGFAICLDRKFEGKGLGTEATRWVVGHAFEQLGMHRVNLGVMEDNARAISVYKSVGFIEEGRKRKSNWQDGRWWDEVTMGILAEDWEAKKTSSQR